MLTILYFDATIKYNFDGKDRVVTEKEFEETKKQVLSAAAFLAIIGGAVLYGYDIISAGWTIPVILLLYAILGGGFYHVIEQKRDTDDDFDLPGFGEPVWQSDKGVPINFSYTDASGKKTKRRIALHKIFKDSKTRFYFQGYCQLRKAERTFVSDKIKDLHDDNGEIIDLPQFINNLTGYAAFGSAEVRAVKEKDKKIK